MVLHLPMGHFWTKGATWWGFRAIFGELFQAHSPLHSISNKTTVKYPQSKPESLPALQKDA
jgi:hypothetical protein